MQIHGHRAVEVLDHSKFNAGTAARLAVADEMIEFTQGQIVEAIIAKFKWRDGEIEEKFGMSRAKLIEAVDRFGFVPPSIKPLLLINIPSSPFKDDIIFMLSKNQPITMKESRWRKLFPDYEPEAAAMVAEEQTSQTSHGEDVEPAPILPGQASPPADTKEAGKKRHRREELPEIPEEVLAEIYGDQSLSPNDLIKRLAREKQVTRKQLAEAANMDDVYLSALLNRTGYIFSHKRVIAFADRLGQKGVRRDQFIVRLGHELEAAAPAAPVLPATDPGKKDEPAGKAAAEGELLSFNFRKLCARYGKELEELAGEVNFTDAEQAVSAAVKITKALGLNGDEVAFLATGIELEFPDFPLTITGRGKGFASFIIAALARNLNAELVTA